jgi:hypothetical protein
VDRFGFRQDLAPIKANPAAVETIDVIFGGTTGTKRSTQAASVATEKLAARILNATDEEAAMALAREIVALLEQE